jgi:hypothetical protein
LSAGFFRNLLIPFRTGDVTNGSETLCVRQGLRVPRLPSVSPSPQFEVTDLPCSGLMACLALVLRSIGFNATISAPHMHAHALEDLEEYIRPGMKVLDVGCGSGYRMLPFVRDAINGMLLTFSPLSPRSVTAVIHRMVSSSESNVNGHVIGIDHLPGLTALATRNLKSDGIEVGPEHGIEIVTGDGRKGSCSTSQRF